MYIPLPHWTFIEPARAVAGRIVPGSPHAFLTVAGVARMAGLRLAGRGGARRVHVCQGGENLRGRGWCSVGSLDDRLDSPEAAVRVLEVLAVAFDDETARKTLDVPGLFRDPTRAESTAQWRAWATARCQFRVGQTLSLWAVRRLAAMGGTMPEARLSGMELAGVVRSRRSVSLAEMEAAIRSRGAQGDPEETRVIGRARRG